MRASGILFVCALGLGAAGCDGLFGSCPRVDTTLLLSGTFQSETAAGQLYPSAEIQRKTIVLDRQAGTVRISYTRNGKAVEERWKIKDIKESQY